MLQSSARLLQLLSLLQNRRFWPGQELAEALEVHPRTLRRDINRLRELGYPVKAATGVAGGYQMSAGAHLPPLMLDDEEALAVSLGLHTSSMGNVSGISEAALRALAKLEQLLPPRLSRQVQALYSSITPLYFAGPSVQPRHLIQLASAAKNREELYFLYEDITGAQARRSVQPHGLVHNGARWYLLAWDLKREGWRTFRVDRIQGAIQSGGRFTQREIPGGDIQSYVAQSISTSAFPIEAEILLHAPLKAMRQRIPPSVGQLRADSESSCVLTLGVYSTQTLFSHLGALGVGFEILSPAELIEPLSALSKSLSQALRRSKARHSLGS